MQGKGMVGGDCHATEEKTRNEKNNRSGKEEKTSFVDNLNPPAAGNTCHPRQRSKLPTISKMSHAKKIHNTIFTLPEKSDLLLFSLQICSFPISSSPIRMKNLKTAHNLPKYTFVFFFGWNHKPQRCIN